ncbi:hypothetical protein DEI81_07990 [Curtobacterium sp. MCBD17_013]|uniref:hypothetical protein n=1 Tax=Curtobacterium sp. MCBD17_013 TaxID=2175668 RepID=UPI000DA92BC5|nr:hypothetical protein [Curtobacterium sp. MCBD17_013]PZF63338.1 hypothetical protein DEI81_07990 [Curtobacterium sp. MCBD17_013]
MSDIPAADQARAYRLVLAAMTGDDVQLNFTLGEVLEGGDRSVVNAVGALVGIAAMSVRQLYPQQQSVEAIRRMLATFALDDLNPTTED